MCVTGRSGTSVCTTSVPSGNRAMIDTGSEPIGICAIVGATPSATSPRKSSAASGVDDSATWKCVGGASVAGADGGPVTAGDAPGSCALDGGAAGATVVAACSSDRGT
jgi:hypothetical protein